MFIWKISKTYGSSLCALSFWVFKKFQPGLCVFLRMLEIFKDSNVRRTVTLQCVVTVTPVGQCRPNSATIV